MILSPAQDFAPLFIVGSVRSGTTLVRDLLRRQPRTICPEETHYFRYADPYGTSASINTLRKNRTLQLHRKIDGISEEEFEELRRTSHTRGELLRRHIAHIAAARGLKEYRWFDKTPQNSYGIALIRAEFPRSKFLHLVRNPLNVIASLKKGSVVRVEDTQAACNCWIEAVSNVRQMSPILGEDLLEVRYEDLIADPTRWVRSILEFSSLGADMSLYSNGDTHAERDQYRKVLTPQDIDIVKDRCGALATRYGYELR